MLRVDKAHWYCPNRACGRTVPSTGPYGDTGGCICVCGTSMRKRAQLTVLSYLDFLWEERPRDSEKQVGEE